jgi:nucleoside-diphosphate-sugar epimerase
MLVRVPDLTKIRRLINYEPRFTLEQTLRQVIDYEKKKGPGKRQ